MNAIEIRKFLVSDSGLSPLICWTLILLDQLMFSLEVMTGGFFPVISLILSFSFGVCSAIYQKLACRDRIVPAIFKGFICFLLLACPTGFVSMLLCPYAVFQTTRLGGGEKNQSG